MCIMCIKFKGVTRLRTVSLCSICPNLNVRYWFGTFETFLISRKNSGSSSTSRWTEQTEADGIKKRRDDIEPLQPGLAPLTPHKTPQLGLPRAPGWPFSKLIFNIYLIDLGFTEWIVSAKWTQQLSDLSQSHCVVCGYLLNQVCSLCILVVSMLWVLDWLVPGAGLV